MRRVDCHRVADGWDVLLNLLELLHLLGNGNDSLAGLRHATGHSFEWLPDSARRRRRDRRLLRHHAVKLLLWLVLRRVFAHRFPLLVLAGWACDFT